MMERFGGEGKKRSVGVEIEAKPKKGWGEKKKEKAGGGLAEGLFAPVCAHAARALRFACSRGVGARNAESASGARRKEGKGREGKGQKGEWGQRGSAAEGRGQGEKRERKRERERGKKRIREGGSAAQGGKNKGEAKPRPAPFFGLSAL